MPRRPTTRTGSFLLVAAALAGLAAQAGCYEKVTRAEGFGAERIPVEESERPDGPLERLIWGESETQKKQP